MGIFDKNTFAELARSAKFTSISLLCVRRSRWARVNLVMARVLPLQLTSVFGLRDEEPWGLHEQNIESDSIYL